MTPEHHAEAILRAAGTSLRHYTMPGTREAILAAVRAAIAPDWRSIADDPPPHEQRVLLAWQDWRDAKWLIIAEPYSTGERVGSYSSMSCHGSATHWLPLPPAPGAV